MTALDQLNGGLALADAAVAEDQHALSVDLDQHAVAGDAGRKHDIEIGDQRRHELTCALGGAEQGHIVLFRAGEHVGGQLQTGGDDDRRRVGGKKRVHRLLDRLARALVEEAHLALAEDLDALGVEGLKEADQRQYRTVDLVGGDLNLGCLGRQGQGFKRKFANQGFEGNAVLFLHMMFLSRIGGDFLSVYHKVRAITSAAQSFTSAPYSRPSSRTTTVAVSARVICPPGRSVPSS